MLLHGLKMGNQFSLKRTCRSKFYSLILNLFFSLACRYVKVHVYCRVHYVGIFVVYARCTVQTGILIFVIYHKKREEIFIQVKPQICADGVCMCANMLNTVEQKKNPPVKKANCNKKLTGNGREKKSVLKKIVAKNTTENI